MRDLQPVLIDSHCHLDFPVFDDDRSVLLKKCQAQNIDSIVVPGVCRKDWSRILRLCQQQKMLFPALGLHPCFMNDHREDDLHELSQLCASESLLAMGEIGLDFFITHKTSSEKEDKIKQSYFFSEQLQIATQYQLPILIHARKSHQETIQFLKHNPSLQGIIHAYSGSYEQAKEYLKLGFKLGFGGAFTYSKATKLRSLITKLPIDVWVLETDAPDMSPIQHHGERNSPQYLSEIAQTFIELYDTPADEGKILEQLHQNTLDVLPKLKNNSGY